VNPFDDPALAARYEDWYSGPGSRADALEKELLRKLLIPSVKTILEVGSGTGHFTRWFRDIGLFAVGIDPSAAMLAEASRRNGVTYIKADAVSLPFADRTFDGVAIVTTLEFVSDPLQVLKEACRVARQELLLGVLNRHSILTWRLRRSGKPLWKAAHFFTPSELTRLVRSSLGERIKSVVWRTTLGTFGCNCVFPWGGFIGMAVQIHE